MIDLLPASEKSMIRDEYRLRVFVVGLATLSFVFLVMIFSFIPTYLFALSRYGVFLTQSQSDETQNRISQVKEMEAAVEEANRKIDLLNSGGETSNVKDLFLGILESKTPGITITGLSYSVGGTVVKKGKEEPATPTTIGIQGKSSDRAALLAFKDALSAKKEFKTVELPISSLVKDMNISFSINITMSSDGIKKTQ